ncbi:YqhG family protein [Calidifontibacillus oryziterrae]|uniref:YqhG family protein n=1 Tax=Calidifontibacillus oryziterrae TaxID=1191699 RepID=UPI00031A4C54|nr:YqhG family protein [Calidifontibacillus oryziterrae]
MQQQDIHNYLLSFFTNNECEIIEASAGHFVTQLTIDLDKQLMNRPFYWHYVEKTGGEPKPTRLAFITDHKKAPKDIKGETIHLGSPRLQQIFATTKKMAAHIRMYEQATHFGRNTPLQPWLGLNVKISYKCDRKKELFLSLGLNLISGIIIDQFQSKISNKTLTPKIPDFCFTLSPLIKPMSGLKRIENVIVQMIENDDHSWASEALLRWEKDQRLLDHFYEENIEKPESYFVEKKALEDQYKPRINIKIINGGLFYLTQHTMQT